jgi:hypothetical protein
LCRPWEGRHVGRNGEREPSVLRRYRDGGIRVASLRYSALRALVIFMKKMDPETSKAVDYAERLMNVAIDVPAASKVELDTTWAKNPKVIALAILCRTISNFRASVLLAQQRQVMEARAIVRILYENMLWIGALRERGAAFVKDMIDDEMFNRQSLAQVTLWITGKHGGDMASPDVLKLRTIVTDIRRQFPGPKKLNAKSVASEGALELAYAMYCGLSLDAVHCSVMALGKHLEGEMIDGKRELTVSVEARTSEREQRSSILHACRALMGVAMGTNELLGFGPQSSALEALTSEFVNNGWSTGDGNDGAKTEQDANSPTDAPDPQSTA